MRSRRIFPRALLSLLLILATLPAAADITNASLEIQGIGLSLVTPEPPTTTGIDIPTTVQTKFGGKENDEAIAIEGLLAVGDLTGPGLDIPLELSTAPGHKFQIPGLSKEGVYTLQNVRLMKGNELLQYATPSSVDIVVADLFKTSIEVRQLTPDEIRARGIVIDARNFEVYEYTLTFLIRGNEVKIPFPVIVDPRTRGVQLMPVIDPYRLPPISTIGVGRWSPPDIIPVVFEDEPLPEEERNTPKAPQEPGEKLYVRPPIPAAIVIPNSLAVMHQFFVVLLNVQNGAPSGSSAKLENVSARIRVPSQLRTHTSKPAVALGQAVPLIDKDGMTVLLAQAKAEAEWSVEALKPGTHTIEIELRGTLKENGQEDVPLVARPRASVVVHDNRFNIAFSHPDTVRKDIEYTTYSFITNTSPAQQTIILSNDVVPCATAPAGANVCRTNGGLSDEVTIPSGETRVIEYKLRSGVTGKVFATAAHIDSEVAQATAQLHMGVSDTGVPLSPTTLVMPYYAQFVSPELVAQTMPILGLGYSLATSPVTSATAKQPRVIKTDVYRRAVDIAQAGQAIFIANNAPGANADAIAALSVDLLGNLADLSEWDALRRQQKYARPAGAAVTRELEKYGFANGLSYAQFVDNFGKALSHRDGYVAALVHGPKVANNARPYALSLRGMASNRRMDIPSEAADGWIRDLPYGELTRIEAPNGDQTGELALLGRWTNEDIEVVVTPSVDGFFEIELLFPDTNDGTTRRVTLQANGTKDIPVRVPLSRGLTTVNALLPAGGFADTEASNVVPLAALRVVGIRQDLYLDEYGHKASILFNRPVAKPAGDLREKFHAEIDFNKDGVVWMDEPRPISGAALQESGRVIDLTFDHVLHTNADYTIEIAPLVDPRDNAAVSFPGEYVPKIDNDRPAGIIYGRFVKGDNTPLADHEVILFAGIFNPKTANAIFEEFENPKRRLPVNPFFQPPQIVNTRADGSYLFEYVPRQIEEGFGGDFRLWGTAENKTKYTYVNGAVRLPKRVHPVTLQLLGRGSAEGTVRYDNGEIAKGVSVTVGSTAFEGVRTATSNDAGFYRVDDLPVGPLAFTAVDGKGNVGYAAGEVATPGEIEQQDISIFRQPIPKNGSVHGVIRRSDTNQPVAGASVGVFHNGYPLQTQTTDAEGRYTFDKVPAGFISVVAAEWSVSRRSANTDFDLRGDEAKQVDLTLSVAATEQTTTVTGEVLREDPMFPGNASKYQRVAGALVKIDQMRIVTADENGQFVITDVPLERSGNNIGAHDPATRRTERVPLPQLTVAGPNHVPILLKGLGQGTIRAKLFDARGLPVSGFEMLVKAGGAHFGMSDLGGGVYELDHLPAGGDYIVRTGEPSAEYGDQEAISTPVRVAFDGHTVSVSLRLPGQGEVRANVKQISIPSDGGQPILTPLISPVSLHYLVWNSSILDYEPKDIEGTTDNNGLPGEAVFPGVPAMRQYNVNSDHPLGHDSANGMLAFDGDLASHTLTLSNLGHIAGVVYAIDGKTPVPGARLRLDDGHQDQGVVQTGLDGKFEFRNVAPNTFYKITAESTQAGIYRTAETQGRIPSNGGLITTSITLLERGQIEGKIVYAAYKVYDPLHPENNVADTTPDDPSDNAPVPLARFWMKELDFPRRDIGTGVQPLQADLKGQFAIDNVFVGRLRATAWAPDNPDLRGDWTATLTREGELLTPYITIGGGGTGAILAKVTNPNANNAPVENAEVQLFRGNRLFDLASSGPDGTVRFEQLPVGDYIVVAYSKALGKSGRAADVIHVTTDTTTEARVMLTFSGQVTGKITDPEAGDAPVAGSHVTISMAEGFQQRFTSTAAGEYLFEGVREGSFTLDAKDTTSNRRARKTGYLSAANPEPVVNLELERTETLHLAVYLPDDFGNNSNILAGPVEVTVEQRGGEFYRSQQGNPIQMPKLFLNEPWSLTTQELGGDRRQLSTFGSFPKGSATQPISLVYPAYGSGEVLVRRVGGTPVADARVQVRVSRYDTRTFYTDSAGRIVATGLPVNRSYSVTVVALDGASGSGSLQIQRTSVLGSLTIEVGSRATLTGKVIAETGGPSIGTPVVISFSGGQLTATTDAQGSFTFAGVAVPSGITLLYYGPDGSTLGGSQTFSLSSQWAGRDDYPVPTITLDGTPPLLLDIAPAQGAATVPPDTHLKFVFSEEIDTTAVNNDTFTLQPADGSPRVNATFTFAPGANGTFVVTMKPPAPPAGQEFPLKSNTLYRLTVSQNVKDKTGHTLGANRGLTFTTADYIEPRVISTVPAAGIPIPRQITYEWRFNEPLDPAPFAAGGNGRVQLDLMLGAGETAAVDKNITGSAYVDPFTGISLFFAPDEETVPNRFYRIKFSGVRDLQGNDVPEQTYYLRSFDTHDPVVILRSPVPDGSTLVSGLTYSLVPELRSDEEGQPLATDIEFVEYFRVENGVETFIKSVKKAPYAYDFVAPDAPPSGLPLVFRAKATDTSVRESQKVEITLTVKPNQPPTVAVALDRTDNVYPGERVNATITASDEVRDINLQLDVKATRTDDTQYRVQKAESLHRDGLNDPWPSKTIAIDLPTNLKGGSTVTFTGIATDMSGLTNSSTTPLTLAVDTTQPVIVATTPDNGSEYSFGTSYKVSANVTDVGTGVAKVEFNVDGTIYTVLAANAVAGLYTSPSIAVTAHSVNTTVPVTITATDNSGNTATRTFEVVYLSIDDPTVPSGEWLCPVTSAVLPANVNNYPLKLRFRAQDDVSVTSVRFRLPGVETLVVPTSDKPDEYLATVPINTPAADKTDYFITAIVTDADPAHTQEFRLRLGFLTPDLTVDSTQAITASTLANYEDKSVVVTGTEGRLVPHVPVRFKNLLVLNGARIETLSTTTSIERKLDMTVTGTMYVDCASSIDVTGRGYLGGNGLNDDGSNTYNTGEVGRTNGNTLTGGARSAGASHGGLGVIFGSGTTNAVYGSYTEPRTLGAGGGAYNNANAPSGGGAVAIAGSATSRFLIAGAIRANGNSGNQLQAGGAGGSVLLQSADVVFSRSARVTANGGNGIPGGGGRVAVHASRALTMPDTNNLQARGGYNVNGGEGFGVPDAGAGTIYISRPSEIEGETTAELRVSAFNEDHATSTHQINPTPLGIVGGDELVFSNITVGPRALLRIDSPYRVTAQDGEQVDAAGLLVGPTVQPTVSFTTVPAAGANVWQNAQIALTYDAAALDGIAQVFVIIPGRADTVEPFTLYPQTVGPRSVNVAIPSNASPGPITIKVRALSRSQRTYETTATYTIVSDAPPQVAFDNVAPATEVYAGGTININASATDDVEVKTLTLASSAGTVTSQPAVKPTATSMTRQFTVAVPKTTPSSTPVVLTLSATDGFPSRPATTGTHTVTIRPDTILPAVTILRPTPNQEFHETANANLTIEVQATDAEVGVNTVKATFEGVEYTLAPVSGQPGRYLIANVPVPPVDGTDPVEKLITVAVTDFEPNTATATQTIFVKPLVDENAPLTAWMCSSPNAMYPAGTAVPLRVSAVRPPNITGEFAVQSVTYSVNGGTASAMTLATAGEYASTFTIPAGTAAGTVFNIRVAAISSSGNEATLLSAITVVAGNEITNARDLSASDVSLDNSTVIVRAGGTLTVTGAHTFTNLVVLDGGKFVQKHLDVGKADAITVQRLFVACNGTIDVSGLGYLKNTTYPGAGNPNDASGGSHIGRGGLWNQKPGGTFGSIYRPMEGGGGGQMMDPSYPAIAGGGSVRIHASSFVTIDGSIQSRVTDTARLGGSAGGSVWITTSSTFAGAGSIDVTGGSTTTQSGGAGAGGSIALEYANASGSILSKLIAKGGTGSLGHHGGAGTVYLKSAAAPFGELAIDNRSVSTTYGVTDLPAFGRIRAASVNGNTVQLEGTRWVMPSHTGHSVRVLAADGTVRGTARITAVTNDAFTTPVNGFHEVLTQDAVAYDGYLYYSAAGLGGKKFVAARVSGGQWQYDTDSAFTNFTPQPLDGVVAAFRKDATRITEITPYRCAAVCGTADGVQILELAGGEIVPNAIGGTDGTNKWELGLRDNAELVLRADSRLRSVIVSKGVNASVTLDGSVTVQPGDVLRGVYRLDKLDVKNAIVTTEDLLEVTNAPTLDLASSLTSGNTSVPVIDTTKLSLTNGLTGPVLVGAAGAITDIDAPVHAVATNTNAPALTGVVWNGTPDEPMVIGDRGGMSVRRSVNGHPLSAGISSLNAITNSGFVTFSAAQTNQPIVIGLAPADTTSNANEAQMHSFKLLGNSTYELWANGANANKNGTYTVFSVFRIEKTPSAIRWFVDGVPVHEVTTNIQPSLILDLSFQNATGGEIHGIEFDTNTAAEGRHRAAVASNGSFKVPVFGQAGETIVLRAIDGHAYPLTANAIDAITLGANYGVQSLAFVPGEVTGGRTSTGTVTLKSPAGPDGARIALSSNSATATVPASITIAAGLSSATFTVTTTAVATPVDAIITATYGNVPTTAQLRVVKDNIAPAVTITLPVANTQYTEGAASGIALETTVIEEDSGIASVVATLDGVSTNLTKNTAKGPNAWTATLAVPFIPETVNVTKNIVVTATDNNANTGSATQPVIIKPISDVTPPVLTWNCFSNGGLYPVNEVVTFLATATVTGTSAIQSVQFFVTTPDGSTTPFTATAIGGNQYRVQYTVPPVADGAQFSVRALATTGGGAEAELTRTFIAVTSPVKISANTTIAANNTTYENQTVIVTAGTTSIVGPHTFKRLVVLSGAKVVHASQDRLDLTATDAIFVACGGFVDANGLGYAQDQTYPGATTPGFAAAGSHIGRGSNYQGNVSGSTFGSVYRPLEMGAGGDDSGQGGGVILLTTPSLTNDGTIRANGTTSREASAGGSVWIKATNIHGSGAIEAKGPNGDRGGAGGAIAIEYTNTSGTILDTASASGGTGTFGGGAGSVYLKSAASPHGKLVVDNGAITTGVTELPSLGNGTAQAGTTGATLVTDRSANVPAYFAGHWVRIRNAAGAIKGTWRVASMSAKSVTLAPNAGETIDLQSGDTWQGIYRFDTVVQRNTILVSVDPIETAEQTITGAVNTSNVLTGDLTLKSGAVLTHPYQGRLNIEVSGTMTVESGAILDANGLGYSSDQTYPGATTPGFAAGGSHIGRGSNYQGNASGSTFGSVYRPAEFGGGGDDSGPGGGVVRINAGTLNVDGTIRANGTSAREASAGGSVWITAGSIGGNGIIEAKGQNSDRGGGGGAIAIEYGTSSGTILSKASAIGGTGTFGGGAGSIYLKSATSAFGSLIVDNGTLTAGVTELPSLGNGTAQNGTSGATLVTDRSANVPAYFVAHWVRVKNAAGVEKGTWRVKSVNAKTVTLEPNGNETIDLAAGDKWQGLYRFDSLTQKNTVLVSNDPIETADQIMSGAVNTSEVHTTNLRLKTGAVLTHPYQGRLLLDVPGELVLESGAFIDANGLGYASDQTYPNHSGPAFAAGGSHIGRGAMYQGNAVPATFGSVYRPAEFGSGGDDSGSGGGVIRIITGTLTNDGTIRANGLTAREAAAGGSIWISTGAIGGNGVIEAKGPSSDRGGAGGAIAIEYTTSSGTVLSKATAIGGTGTNGGGAGSVYLKSAASTYGTLILDNGGLTTGITDLPSLGSGIAQNGTGGDTLVTDRSTNVPAYFVAHWVRVKNAAGVEKGTWRVKSVNAKTVTLEPNASESISLVAGDSWQGLYRFDTLTQRNVIVVSADPIETNDQSISGAVTSSDIFTKDLVVKTGAVLKHPYQGRLAINATGAVTIEASATIDANGLGYGSDQSYPGGSLAAFAGGGSHLGSGGTYQGGAPPTTFGSVYRPSELGGGGDDTGSGGGVVRIIANALTIDGLVRANGLAAREGAAGGSVWITTNTLSGLGTIEAKGVSSDRGGAGGAIAIEYNTVSGTILTRALANGGTGGTAGGAGTLFTKSASATYGSLRVFNNNIANGEQTALPSLGSGNAAAGSANATLVTERITNIPPYFVGHYVEVKTNAGTVKGLWRVASINNKTMTLAPNGSESIDIQPGDFYLGVYRFDDVQLATTRVVSADPIRSTNPIDQGTTVVNINDGPPSFPAAKRSQIVVESAVTGDAVSGPAGAVTDANTPIKLTATNTRTNATFTGNANADGSFRISVSGAVGDTFTLSATDSHGMPLSSPTIAVNSAIVELNSIVSVTIQPSTVTGGTTVYGSVRLSAPARASGAIVSLSSANGTASVPQTLTILNNTLSAQFAISTSAPASTSEAQITASLGTSSVTASLTVTPAASALADLVLTTSTVEGGASVNGTVLLGAPAPPGGALVMLTSNTPQAGVPETVVVPEGSTQTAFTVTTTKVSAATRASISATWGNSIARDLDLTACNAMTTATPPSSASMNTMWFDDAAPANATASGDATFDSTQFAAGTKALHFAPPTSAPIRTWSFTGAAPLTVNPGDRLVLYALVNPCNPPRQILAQWSDGTTQYRASWGENRINTLATLNAGSVPPGGTWQRLELVAKTLPSFPATAKTMTGFTLSVDGGEAWFDASGVASCSTAKASMPAYLPNERVWFDDGAPSGATLNTAYNWESSQVASGATADLVGTPADTALAQHYFTNAPNGPVLKLDDMLVVYVFLDPCNPPRELMLQFSDTGTGYNRRAYWGENLIDFGGMHTVQRRRMGPLPEAGKWVRLEVPVTSMQMTGMQLNGVAFALYGGRAWFDRVATASRVNLALGKSATQSTTTQSNNPEYAAGKAIDGDFGNYSHTESQAQPYWQVDLGSVQPIETIDVWTITLCCQDRLQNYWVFVSDDPFQSASVAATIAQAGVTSYYFKAQAQYPTSADIARKGRYVRVQLAGTNYLHIAEVQVWAPVTQQPFNLAGGRAASQSSTYGNAYLAASAVNGYSGPDAQSHTDSQLEPWWQVDLGEVKAISTVDIDNAYTSDYWTRMANFYVFVSDNAFASTAKVADLLARSDVSAYYRVGPLQAYKYDVNRSGRFVRIQLTGTNYLHPMEVRVWSPSLRLGALAKPVVNQ